MLQVLQENRKPTIAERFAAALQTGVQGVGQYAQARQAEQLKQAQAQKISQITGMDLSGLSPEMQQEVFKQHILGQREERKMGKEFEFQKALQEQKYGFEESIRAKEAQAKAIIENSKASEKTKNEAKKLYQDKIAPLEAAKGRIAEMKALRKKGNLGRMSALFGLAGGETAKDRGAYKTLGNSLISYAATIPIRNKAEFETLTGKINDPNITDAEAQGVLEQMERIVQDAIDSYDYQEMLDADESVKKPKTKKRSLQSFKR